MNTFLASTFVSNARSLRGVPWRHRGRNPRSGLDCLGFVLVALLLSGWKPQNEEATSRLDYDRLSTGDDLHRVLRGEGRRLEEGEAPQAGDVLTFTFPGHAHTQHVGVLTGDLNGCPYFIHCRAGADKATSCVTEHALADGWLQALDGIYRIDGCIDACIDGCIDGAACEEAPDG